MLSPLKKVGRVGLKALLYFEAMTTLALIIGLIVVNLWRPGVGMNVEAKTLDISSVQSYVTQARSMSAWDYIAHIIPNTVVSAFAEGEILQVLFFAILFAFSLQFMRERGEPVRQFIEAVTETFFGIVRLVMRAAPIGALGAMAFTICRYSVGTLIQLGQLYGERLYDMPAVYSRGARRRRSPMRLQHTEIHPLHQGRAVDRSGHLVLGVGLTAHDGEDGTARLSPLGGGFGDSDWLFIQSGRYLHLPDDGGDVSRTSDEYRTYSVASDHDPPHPVAYVEGGRRRNWERLYRACRYALLGRAHPCRDDRPD